MSQLTKSQCEHELIAMITQILAETGEPYKRSIHMDDSLQRHLGLDSLGRSELFQRIEKKFNVAMPDRLLAEADTLNDIMAYVLEARPKIKEISNKSIVHSHGVHASVDPSKAHTLLDVLLMYGEGIPDKPHIYFQNENGQEETITYGQLLDSSLRMAASLRAHGLQVGETVAIMQPTHPVFFYTFLGTLLAGGIPVPIYPPFRAHMLEAYAKTEARILRNAEVRILVTFEQAETLSRLLQAFVPSLKVVTTAHDLLRGAEALQLTTIPKTQSHHFAFIQYTSGSTSEPKGVLLTHANVLSNIRAYGAAIQVTPDDVAVSWLPLYHDMGLIGAWLGSLYHGIPLILMTPFSFLNHPERWLWAIHYHRGTLSGAPNFAYELCVRKIDPALLEGLDLSSWRVAANGAEKVYPGTLRDFAKKFLPYGFKAEALTPMYGLAESAVALTIPPMKRGFIVDRIDRKPFEQERLAVSSQDAQSLEFVSCGMPIQGHEIRILDENNQMLSERHVGGLQFRGPSSMQGYYRHDAATKAIYHDGWLDTGDLAYIADGELYVTGRRKDLIIKAGRNLYPAEIEELVSHVSGVRMGCVAAFGVTDSGRGTEQLIVVAETREPNKDKQHTIVQGVMDAIASTLDMVPDHVILVAPHVVPKTSSGKLQRAACKSMYLEGRLGKIRAPAWWQMIKLGAGMVLRKTMSLFLRLAKCLYTCYVIVLVVITALPVYILVCSSTSMTSMRICQKWAHVILTLALCRVKVSGLEKLYQTSPLIFASNHASYIDAIVTLALVPMNTRYVAKKELFSVPILRTFMRKLRILEVDRMDFSKGLEDTRLIEAALKEGDSVFIFPEGTFGYASGLRPFRLGAFKMAAETDVPICPVGLAGTRVILRDNEKLMRPGTITVTVCDLVYPMGVEWHDVTRLRNTVRVEIAKYCGEPSLDFIAAQTVAPKLHRDGEVD